MKCVVLQASPRKGGNCEVLVNEITSAMENYDVVNYFLDDLNIEPCHACGGCGDGVKIATSKVTVDYYMTNDPEVMEDKIWDYEVSTDERAIKLKN